MIFVIFIKDMVWNGAQTYLHELVPYHSLQRIGYEMVTIQNLD